MRNVLLLNGIIIPLPSTYYPLFNQLLSPSSPFQPPFFFCPHLFALSSAQAEKVVGQLFSRPHTHNTVL